MTTSKIATAFKTATFALAAGAVALGLASPADAAAGTMYGDPAAAAKYWRQLGSGHAVIVSINAEMIWGQPVEETDSAGNPRSDHAVVVTGVDTENGIVHLNDSGTPTGRDEQIPMETFVEAWATSHDFMAVTT